MTLDREQVMAALPAYKFGGELGRGGWGVVLEARHTRLGRDVAIKQLPRAFGADPSVRARFVAEAQVLASLDHPHIVPVYDYVEVEGLCLLVMEKLTGGTLWNRFVTDGLTMETSCAVMLAASAGLHAAHQRGILHRDVKPENLMFSASGVLKVTDFGIAKVVGGSRTMATRAGEVLGTPSYMAPEHARGETLGPPADVYASGVVLYELLSGRLPFSDEGEALAVLYRHVHEAPVPLPEVAPDVPPGIAAVVMRSLASLPGDRYPSAEAFGVDLADAAGAAWGPGWASARTEVTVMGSSPIVAAIERSAAFSGPPAGKAPATVVVEPQPSAQPTEAPAHDPARVPAPVTAAVRPTEAGASRHVAQRPPESPALGSLHEVPAIEAPAGRARPRRRRRGPVLAGVAVLAGVVVAALLALGGGEDPHSQVAASPPTTRAGQPPLFQDDFSDPASGWTQLDRETHRLAYVSGKYLVLIRQPEYRVLSDTELEGPAYRPGLVTLGDVAIEVDAESIVSVRTQFGLACRGQPNGDFYMALVDSAGRARIEKVSTSQRLTLGNEPVGGMDAPGTKHLRLECVGGSANPVSLRLFVDGKLAVEAGDHPALAPGIAGVVTVSEDRAGSQVLFDNFVIKAVA